MSFKNVSMTRDIALRTMLHKPLGGPLVETNRNRNVAAPFRRSESNTALPDGSLEMKENDLSGDRMVGSLYRMLK